MRKKLVIALIITSFLSGCGKNVADNTFISGTKAATESPSAVRANSPEGPGETAIVPDPGPESTAAPQNNSLPELAKISHGELWATKTYVNDFADSLDGTKVLYRYFPDAGSQPVSRTSEGFGGEMWMAAPDGSGQTKLFDLPGVNRELGHGSEAMIWIDSDKFYYNGILYDTAARAILWKLPNDRDVTVPYSAWSNAVDGKLYVNIRSGANAGYYRIDPTGDAPPQPVKVLDRAAIKPFLGGNEYDYQFTYIKLSPGGTYLYFVMYLDGKEYGFTSRADGSEIVRLGSNDDISVPFNGHAIWFDDSRLIYPSTGNVKICSRDGSGQEVAAGRGNHITLSPDKSWLIADDGSRSLWLYKVGNTLPVAQLLGDDIAGGFTDAHPSFGRDGGRVYFMARSGEKSNAVYSADVSRWTKDPDFRPLEIIQHAEAEDMDLTGYFITDFASASGGRMITANSTFSYAEFKFTGNSGTYDINITYRDENKGPSSFELYLDGNLADKWVADRVGPGGRDDFYVRTVKGVRIENGQIIRIRGYKAASPARLDCVDIIGHK